MPMNPRLLRPLASGFLKDADAIAYVAAVEAADGQKLEKGVALAYESFITGCKSDGIWDAIKASCILAGARTLAGALVPLRGVAPTNNNFVSGDYNRETGLVGDGSTKFLNSNRADAADPQDSKHISVYVNPATSLSAEAVIGVLSAGATVGSQVYNDTGQTYFRANSASSLALSGILQSQAGLVGCSRADASTLNYFVNGSAGSAANASASPGAGNIHVFERNFTPQQRSDERIQFYSIGESLDLADLDTRVSALITAIGAAV